MNWGYGIMTVIIVFVLGIGGMVLLSSKQSIDMMDDKYYERELKHQQLIDESASFVSDKGSVALVDSNGFIELRLPLNVSDSVVSGGIEIIRPSDKRLDRYFELKPLEGKQRFDKSDFVRGLYHVRMSWINGRKSYYQSFDYTVR